MIKNNKRVIALGFEGEYSEMTFDEALEQIKDCAKNDSEDYEEYVSACEKNENPTREDYAKFKAKCAYDDLKKYGSYEFAGVDYNILDSKFVEEKWNYFNLKKDIFLKENNNDLILKRDWFIFEKGISKKEIYKWFNDNHPKGICFLTTNIMDTVHKVYPDYEYLIELEQYIYPSVRLVYNKYDKSYALIICVHDDEDDCTSLMIRTISNEDIVKLLRGEVRLVQKLRFIKDYITFINYDYKEKEHDSFTIRPLDYIHANQEDANELTSKHLNTSLGNLINDLTNSKLFCNNISEVMDVLLSFENSK